MIFYEVIIETTSADNSMEYKSDASASENSSIAYWYCFLFRFDIVKIRQINGFRRIEYGRVYSASLEWKSIMRAFVSVRMNRVD